MDLAQPLRSLIPSLDSAALEVLARTESALGISRIRRLAGRGSWAGYQHVLDRLVEDGLVTSEPTNSGFVYRLNRDHLLVPALLQAASVRGELLTRLSSALTRLEPRPSRARVFGSLARGEGDSSSDIDLFLLMPEAYAKDLQRWNEQMQALQDSVLAWTGNRLEVLVLTPAQLKLARDREEPILASIAREGIDLAGVTNREWHEFRDANAPAATP